MTIIRTVLLTALSAVAIPAFAVETKTWVQSEAAEFEKGALKGLSVSSNGRLTLAPVFKELFDPAVSHLWAVVADARGTLYAGGAGGKLWVVEGGKGRLLAELAGGDIYALATGGDGNIYAAVSPEAKVYRVSPAGRAELFYSAKARYIWALRFDARGGLLVATGDPGEIHRVTPAGAGSVLFDTGETHARSLVLDPQGNLVIGTEPGGLILRVTPAGAGFVLYQTPRREVTALAVAADGAIYSAAVGLKTPALPVVAPPPAAVPTQTQAAQATVQPQAAAQAVRPPATPPPAIGQPTVVTGGSEIYRTAPDGETRRVWNHAQHVVYTLAFDKDQHLLAGSGNQGLIFRLDSGRVWTRLVDAGPGQVTSLAAGPGGAVLASTANVGKLFTLGPQLEREGTIESEPFDAASFTYWGRLRWEGAANGGAVRFEASSGNLERRQKNWSPWTPVPVEAGGRIEAPAARFLVWRAVLTAAADGRSPELGLVEAAYRAKNVAPTIEQFEITPYNYKFPAAILTLTPSTTLSLPVLGQQRRAQAPTASTDGGGAATLNYDKGYLGARWRAGDPNGDTLSYRLEIRGEGETVWKPLKDGIKESRYSWDATGFADGRYRLRLTASDAPDNVGGSELTATLESDAFTIDTGAPQIGNLSGAVEGGRLVLRWRASDAASALQSAEYSINGGEWSYAEPTTGLTDSQSHEYRVDLPRPAGGEVAVAVRVSDEMDNTAVARILVRLP